MSDGREEQIKAARTRVVTASPYGSAETAVHPCRSSGVRDRLEERQDALVPDFPSGG